MLFDSFIWDKIRFILPIVIGVLVRPHLPLTRVKCLREKNLLTYGFHVGSDSLQQRTANQ